MDAPVSPPYDDLMTNDQYTELVGFLGQKFDGIARELVEVRRHATVLFEQARGERRTMAEGIEARLDAIERHISKIDSSRSAPPEAHR